MAAHFIVNEARMSEWHVVTGAFGYSGKYIAARLLEAGVRVRTLTHSPRRANPFGGKVEAHPFNFDNPAALVESLRGAAVLYNTYWIRFNTREPGFQHAAAVSNTLKLFEAARQAGVPRVVHTSITNPSEDSPLEYFKGKAVLERTLKESGLSHAILRPNVLFGREDILINNIAWTLRRLPVFGVFGDGQYRLQPMHVDDFAALAVEQGKDRANRVIDAIGPETFTYRRLVERSADHRRAPPDRSGAALDRLCRWKGAGETARRCDDHARRSGRLTWPICWSRRRRRRIGASPRARNTRHIGQTLRQRVARRKNRQAAYETYDPGSAPGQGKFLTTQRDTRDSRQCWPSPLAA
jgi:NADH dehydrogenase